MYNNPLPMSRAFYEYESPVSSLFLFDRLSVQSSPAPEVMRILTGGVKMTLCLLR